MRRNGDSVRKADRRRLLEKRAELLAEIGSSAPDLPARTADEDEQASLMHDQYVAVSVYDMALRQLVQVDLAIDRMHRGEYGVCAICGEPIKERRLESIPWAVYCVQCQDAGSHHQAERGTIPGTKSRQW